ncbi:MAG: hypothetical protein ACK59M_12620 [Pseudomonadota bacterium]|jgi:hypothetical protein
MAISQQPEREVVERLSRLSRSLWFRGLVTLAALGSTVAIGPWMVVAVLSAAGVFFEGSWAAGVALGSLGAGGLLGLAGLWLGAALPVQVVASHAWLGRIVQCLLSVGTVAALAVAAWLAAGGALMASVLMCGIAIVGGVLLVGCIESVRRLPEQPPHASC